MITVKGIGGALNAPPIITDLKVNGEITQTEIPISYKASDADMQILRHFLTVKSSEGTVINNLEITKNVGYEKSEYIYKIQNLNKKTNYTIQITCTDGIISTNSSAIQAQTKADEIFGFVIDESIADPNNPSRVTYIEGADGITPATANGLGEWENNFPFKDLKIVGIKNGVETKEVNKNNKKQYIDGSSVPADVDLFLKIPKLWISTSKSGKKITVKLSSEKKLSEMKCIAHCRNNKEYNNLYIGIYRASLDADKLRTLSEKNILKHTLTIKKILNSGDNQAPTVAKARSFARNYYKDAELHTWSSDQLLKILYILAFKSTNKDILGTCNDVLTTGSADQKGFLSRATASTSSVFLGIEDLWGTAGGPAYIDGITMHLNAYTDRFEFKYFINKDNRYSTSSFSKDWEIGYKDTGSPFLNSNAYNKTTFLAECMGKNDIPFYPYKEGATANTHYMASLKTPMFSFSEDKIYFYTIQESLFAVDWSKTSIQASLRVNLFKD